MEVSSLLLFGVFGGVWFVVWFGGGGLGGGGVTAHARQGREVACERVLKRECGGALPSGHRMYKERGSIPPST